MEYLIRPARITDIARLAALGGGGVHPDDHSGPLDAADLMRQLVSLPQASIVVAEAQREVVGGAILTLRPSVRAGGFVGSVDVLVVGPGHDADRVTDALLEEVVRSARNKGCTVVEAPAPEDAEARSRFERRGFSAGTPLMARWIAETTATANRAG